MGPTRDEAVSRAVRRTAWGGWLVAVALAASTVILLLATGAPIRPQPNEPDVLDGIGTLLLLSFPTVGAIVAARRPRNPLGWMLLAAGVATAFEDLVAVLSHRAFVIAPGSVPGATYLALAGDAVWIPSVVVGLVLLLLLFPDGRLPSPRWRPVLVLAGAAGLLSVPVTVLRPGALFYAEEVANPLGLAGTGQLLPTVQAGLGLVLVGCVLAALVALVRRFRRARGVERQQLSWFLTSAVVGIVALVVAVAGEDTIVGSLMFEVAVALLPIAIGVAILRYRLYDLDRLVSRTVAYALLSAVLAGVYAAVVLTAQAVFGGDDVPDVVVAAATLTIAALFRPLRSRVQGAVDRRFARTPFDPQAETAAFAQRLRAEMDLGVQVEDLQVTVARTLAPASVGLWLVSAETEP